MSVVSFSYILFFLVCTVLFYAVPKVIKPYVLLLFSLLFYSFAGYSAFMYLGAVALCTYFSALILQKVNKKSLRKLAVAICCLICFGILGMVKYYSSLSQYFAFDFVSLNLIAPLGISFYTFCSVGYVVDVYRKKVSAQKNFFKHLLFVCFFPGITQGPISRYKDLSCQLFEYKGFSADNITYGIVLMLWGYFKKLVIADRASILVNGIIDAKQSFGGALTILAFVFYCIQLYCDFSGGIDIIRGSSRCLGITLAQNFRRPFFATSLTDFWRRWHITLGSWMRDYVFYPLSLSKPFIAIGKFFRKTIKGKAGKIIPVSMATFIVYFLIGVWHGGSPKYLVFGVWNGFVITLSLLLEPLFSKIKNTLKINDKSVAFKIFAIARTNLIVLLGRFITRSATVSSAIGFLTVSFTDFKANALFDGTLLSFGLTTYDYIVIIFGVAIMLTAEFIGEIKNTDIIEDICKKPCKIYFATLLLGVAVLLLGVFRGNYISSEFIYKQF